MRVGVPVVASLMVGVAAGLSAAPGTAQQSRPACAADRYGAATVGEVTRCDGNAERLAEQASAGASADSETLRQQFAQADEDGDGRISREEWLRSFGPAHAQAEGPAGGAK